MKTRKYFYLIKRGSMFYEWEAATGKRKSLETRDRREAEQQVNARNAAIEQPGLNLALGKIHLAAADPQLVRRTWADVIEAFCKHGKPETQAHRRRQLKSPAFDPLRSKVLVETRSEDFLGLLNGGRSFVHANLRCLHNLAVGMGWLPWPVLPPKLWPKFHPKTKRGVTRQEHERILASEKNVERRHFYDFLWHVGAAQSDAADMLAGNIEWEAGVIRYCRMKTKEWACLVIGASLAELLRQLPSEGPLFPTIRKSSNGARSAEFGRRCRIAEVQGVCLHSYRYAWAERAKAAGYPERFAQSALGHNSRAVHQAYAKGGTPVCPSLDDFEAEMKKRVIPLPLRQAITPDVDSTGERLSA